MRKNDRVAPARDLHFAFLTIMSFFCHCYFLCILLEGSYRLETKMGKATQDSLPVSATTSRCLLLASIPLNSNSANRLGLSIDSKINPFTVCSNICVVSSIETWSPATNIIEVDDWILAVNGVVLPSDKNEVKNFVRRIVDSTTCPNLSVTISRAVQTNGNDRICTIELNQNLSISSNMGSPKNPDCDC